MQEPTLKFAVTCPDCALESLTEIPIAVIANALLAGKSIRLRASCHDQYWTATFLEREQLRLALAAMTTDEVDLAKNPTSPIHFSTKEMNRRSSDPENAQDHYLRATGPD
jgi:hypothetical protein